MHIQIYQQELQCSVVIRLTYDLGSKNVLVPGQEMQVMIIYMEETDEFAFIKFVRIHFTDSKSQTQEGRMPRCPPPHTHIKLKSVFKTLISGPHYVKAKNPEFRKNPEV